MLPNGGIGMGIDRLTLLLCPFTRNDITKGMGQG